MKVKKIMLLLVMSLILPLSCLPFLSGCKAKLTNNVVVEDNGALLTNPNMGWNFTYYANTIYDFGTTLKADDYLDAYPCDIVFFRIGWNWLEPEEGKFNWAFTDDIADKWIAKGKRIAFCWAATFPGDQSTPLWVKDVGADGVDYSWKRKILGTSAGGELEYDLTDPYYYFSTDTANTNTRFENIPLDAQEWTRNMGIRKDANYNGGNEVAEGDLTNYRGTWAPYYDDEVFLTKWENFLKAAAQRYDNNPAVEFVEIGSFGDWGEGHSSNTIANPITREIKKTHIDLYLKHFKNVQLFINDDPITNTSLVDYAIEKNLGMSDHSVQVPLSGMPEGRIGNSDLANKFYKTAPVLLENHNGTNIMKNYFDSVNNCHATYARINCSPYTPKTSEWTNKVTLRLGYRLAFTDIAFNDIRAGKKINFEFKIKNNGAAYCYNGGIPTFSIVDSLGRIIETAVSDIDVKSLEVADSAETAKTLSGIASLTMPKTLPEGSYKIAVSVNKDSKPYYNLPLDHEIGDSKRFVIATYKV